mgnify:FL=1|tara:strand:- start:284 stop:565 length:282 start_codon:yes stop_codon:yes gene_type:complete
MPRKKQRIIDLEKYPIKVGDYVKVNLSGLGSELYQIEQIHQKENKKGELETYNYTVALNEGSYTHRIGENGTMFVTGKQGYKKTNLKNRITKI